MVDTPRRAVLFPYGLLTGYALRIARHIFSFSILLTGKPRLNTCRKIPDHGGDLISVRRIYPHKSKGPRRRFDPLGTRKRAGIQPTTCAFTEKILLRLSLSAGLRARGKNYYLVQRQSDHDNKQRRQNPPRCSEEPFHSPRNPRLAGSRHQSRIIKGSPASGWWARREERLCPPYEAVLLRGQHRVRRVGKA